MLQFCEKNHVLSNFNLLLLLRFLSFCSTNSKFVRHASPSCHPPCQSPPSFLAAGTANANMCGQGTLLFNRNGDSSKWKVKAEPGQLATCRAQGKQLEFCFYLRNFSFLNQVKQEKSSMPKRMLPKKDEINAAQKRCPFSALKRYPS